MGVFEFVIFSLLVVELYAATIQENKYQKNQSHDENCFKKGKKWVVLVSGSDGWNNYRHQANICHAYQLIRKNGIPKENIITMMVDDIAFNYNNPVQGTIINKPNGTDVYDGVVIDYSGSDVNVNNFLNVLLGNKELLTGLGSGKVVEGGHHDTIFINFIDHGSTGLLAFPNEVLWADQLNEALTVMYKKKSYSKVLMYVEACDSGSMFDGILPDDTNVMVVTSSGPREHSYGYYCDKDSGEYYTCLGGLFGVMWMEDLDETLDEAVLKKQNVFKNYANVRYKVKLSDVMFYGDFRLGSNKLSDFIGYRKSDKSTAATKLVATNSAEEKIAIPNRDVNAYEIKYKLADGNITNQERKNLETKIRENNKMKSIIDRIFRSIYLKVTMVRPEIQDIIGQFDQPKNLGLTLDIFPCYRSIVDKISELCFSVARNPYSFNRLRILSNICVVDKQIHKMVENIISKVCLAVPKPITNVY